MSRARVKMGSVKSSLKSRIDAWTVLAHKAPTSPLYTSNKPLKTLADDAIAKGQEVVDSNTKILQMEADLAHERASREEKALAFDLAYTSLASAAETATKDEADLMALGLDVRDDRRLPLAPPEKVEVSSMPGTGVIEVAILGFDGQGSFVVEVSPDPATDASFARVAGTGAKRQVKGLAPGLYWVRVALQKAKDQSAWGDARPVQVR